MSVVVINVLTVPGGNGEVLEQRFAARAGAVDKSPGFEGFQLLRPTEGQDRYFVVTQWETQEAFQAWMDSQAFGQGHAQAARDRGSDKPASTGSEVWQFDVVLDVTPA
jgi:heme-degrading monooxygenase HmoA